MVKFLKRHGLEMLFGLVFLAGMSLMLYPSVSNWWNERHTTGVVNDYEAAVSALPQNVILQEQVLAQQYNEELRGDPGRMDPDAAFMMKYMARLNVDGSGVMGYIEIPVINVSLPIYHTAEEKYLQVGVGHLEGTSLPVGGPGTHCFLSGHRGLPSSKLFTDLDKVQIGDTFRLRVLGEVLTYQVDQIDVVLPDEAAEHLMIHTGQDLVTLVTCTPYGVNTHRLLVRGVRVPTEGALPAGSFGDASLVNSAVQSAVLAVVLYGLGAAVWFLARRLRDR